MQSILNGVGDAVLTISKTGCIEDANPAASAMFGWNAESLRRMHIGELMPAAKAISTVDGGLMPVRSRQDVVKRRTGERITVLMHVSDVQLLDRTLSNVRRILKETGEETVILTALCGHGHFDLAAYDNYLSGGMVDEEVSDARFAEALSTLPQVVG